MKLLTLTAIGAQALAVALAALAGIPTDSYPVDVRTKGKQFALSARLRTSPCWVFTLSQGGTAWTATGWTAKLRWSASESSAAMGTLTGTVSGSTVTIQAATNSLLTAVTAGYCRLTLSSNDTYQAYADGTIDLKEGPEIP
jgi:hypothetical protein